MKPSKEQVLIQAYGDHEKSLLKRSFFKLNNKELANDLVQTTFLKTWEYLIKHGKIDSIKAFLFHVLNNLIIDEYRKKKTVSLDLLMDGGLQVALDDKTEMINKIDGKTALILIPLLPEKYRIVINMHFIEDMTLQEISEVTLQSKNTVSVQIRRGVDKLAILFRVNTENKKI